MTETKTTAHEDEALRQVKMFPRRPNKVITWFWKHIKHVAVFTIFAGLVVASYMYVKGVSVSDIRTAVTSMFRNVLGKKNVDEHVQVVVGMSTEDVKKAQDILNKTLAEYKSRYATRWGRSKKLQNLRDKYTEYMASQYRTSSDKNIIEKAVNFRRELDKLVGNLQKTKNYESAQHLRDMFLRMVSSIIGNP